MREIVEQLAFVAREDKKVDKRSGVSQRLPIIRARERHVQRRAARFRARKMSLCRVCSTFTQLYLLSPASWNLNTKAS